MIAQHNLRRDYTHLPPPGHLNITTFWIRRHHQNQFVLQHHELHHDNLFFLAFESVQGTK